MASMFYSIGRFVGANKIASAAVVVGTVYVVWVVNYAGALINPDPSPVARPVVHAAAAAAAGPTPVRVDPMREPCTTGISAIIDKAKGFVRQKEYVLAWGALDECKQHMTDLRALDLYKQLTIDVTNIQKRAIAAAERADKAAKKKAGVVIGMSRQDALDSSWGRPNKINRTVRASGTHEQWVYDGGYLYFEDDVLTAIQN